jgi:type IV secretion system protein VirB9
MRIGIALLLVFFHCNVVWALKAPKISPLDPHIQQVNYQADNVVTVNATPGIATDIQFDKDEDILDMATGFSQGWELVNVRNHLYVKPKSIQGKNDAFLAPEALQWNTNLLVTTQLRVYAFQLQLIVPDAEGKLPANTPITYRLTFHYPEEKAQQAKSEKEKRQTENQLNQSAAPRNWHYTMSVNKGSESIAPLQVYDDGRFTYLRFPGNRPFPAVYSRNAKGDESLVNSHIDPQHPDVMVIHQVEPLLLLRFNQSVVGIYNERFDSTSLPTHQGTTVTGIKRQLRGETTHE